VPRRHTSTWIVLALIGASALPARAADAPAPKARDLDPPKVRVVDPAKAKAQELEKQRLLAKLHADAPKVVELHSGANPLDAPIFHRYDRP
jgi:hypothetical protein